jgi:hypothetical protein
MSTEYFEEVATSLWQLNWEAIVSAGRLGERERNAIEATILNKYGKSISLRGTPDCVRDAIQAARG